MQCSFDLRAQAVQEAFRTGLMYMHTPRGSNLDLFACHVRIEHTDDGVLFAHTYRHALNRTVPVSLILVPLPGGGVGWEELPAAIDS